MVYEMLTGKRLYDGETITDTMAAVLRADPPWELLPKDTPPGVLRLLERCLEREGRRRLRDIGEARVRLERWRENPESMHASQTTIMSAIELAPTRSSRLPWVLCGVAILVAALLGLRLATLPEPEPSLQDLEIAVVDGEDLLRAGTLALLSPDGKRMAWNTREGIWIREIARPQSQLLEGTNGSFAMCFSPDSQWLAFTAQGELQRVSISGGTPITICELPTPRGIAWVDESSIVFSPTISSGLMHVDLVSGEIVELTQIDSANNERSHRWPTAVPGERAVLFECQFIGRDYDQSDIQIVSLDDRQRRTIYRGGAAPQATDRGQLLFVRGHTLFAVKYDADAGETFGLPVPVREGLVSSVGNQEDDRRICPVLNRFQGFSSLRRHARGRRRRDQPHGLDGSGDR